MSVWKKTKLYLGLAADEEYDETYDLPEAQESVDVIQHPAEPARPRPVEVTKPAPAPERHVLQPRPSAPAPRSVVRPIPAAATAKPHVVAPASFNDAQEVGEKYKSKQPVIMNLQNVQRDLSRRLIDFASGLCYGVGGRMEKVADYVYLLTPSDVEVSAEERQRLRDRGLHDE